MNADETRAKLMDVIRGELANMPKDDAVLFLMRLKEDVDNERIKVKYGNHEDLG